MRDTREARTLAGNRSLSWGRVVVAEEIYGYREASSTSAPADVALSTRSAHAGPRRPAGST
ncbi:MAG: hypothetical protein U0Z44_22205 [Kouleothrix sp.]